MIFSFFLTILFSLLGLLIGVLPVGAMSTEISTALSYFIGVLNTFNYVFPVDTLLAVLTIALSVELTFLLWNFANWVYHKIRG